MSYFHRVRVQKYNPFHDEKGRFTTKDKAVVESLVASNKEGKAISPKQVGFLQDYADFLEARIDNMPGGAVREHMDNVKNLYANVQFAVRRQRHMLG